jgi:hypothetical protein
VRTSFNGGNQFFWVMYCTFHGQSFLSFGIWCEDGEEEGCGNERFSVTILESWDLPAQCSAARPTYLPYISFGEEIVPVITSFKAVDNTRGLLPYVCSFSYYICAHPERPRRSEWKGWEASDQDRCELSQEDHTYIHHTSYIHKTYI